MGLGREYLPSTSGPDAVKYPVRYLDIWQHVHTPTCARARTDIMPYRDERKGFNHADEDKSFPYTLLADGEM